jgi:hypothetical protein
MSKQPEALRLADRMERNLIRTETEVRAAAELRRLHAINVELLDAFDRVVEELPPWAKDIAAAAIAKAQEQT